MTGKNIISVDSIDSLRNISGTTNVVAMILVNDSLHSYTWDDENTSDDDDNTVIKPNYFTTQSGRWVKKATSGDNKLPDGTIASITVGGIQNGDDLSGKTLSDTIIQLIDPETSPGVSISVDNPIREVGASGDYTVNWSVTKGTKAIIAITVDGLAITPNGGNQSGSFTGTATNTAGSKNFSIVASSETRTSTANASLVFATKYFFGTGDSSTSAIIKAANSVWNGNNNITLNTGSSDNSFWIWLPTGRTLSKVIDANINADITSYFTSSSMSISDGGSGTINGTLYKYTQAVPYTENHVFNISIN